MVDRAREKLFPDVLNFSSTLDMPPSWHMPRTGSGGLGRDMPYASVKHSSGDRYRQTDPLADQLRTHYTRLQDEGNLKPWISSSGPGKASRPNDKAGGVFPLLIVYDSFQEASKIYGAHVGTSRRRSKRGARKVKFQESTPDKDHLGYRNSPNGSLPSRDTSAGQRNHAVRSKSEAECWELPSTALSRGITCTHNKPASWNRDHKLSSHSRPGTRFPRNARQNADSSWNILATTLARERVAKMENEHLLRRFRERPKTTLHATENFRARESSPSKFRDHSCCPRPPPTPAVDSDTEISPTKHFPRSPRPAPVDILRVSSAHPRARENSIASFSCASERCSESNPSHGNASQGLEKTTSRNPAFLTLPNSPIITDTTSADEKNANANCDELTIRDCEPAMVSVATTVCSGNVREVEVSSGAITRFVRAPAPLAPSCKSNLETPWGSSHPCRTRLSTQRTEARKSSSSQYSSSDPEAQALAPAQASNPTASTRGSYLQRYQSQIRRESRRDVLLRDRPALSSQQKCSKEGSPISSTETAIHNQRERQRHISEDMARQNSRETAARSWLCENQSFDLDGVMSRLTMHSSRHLGGAGKCVSCNG